MKIPTKLYITFQRSTHIRADPPLNANSRPDLSYPTSRSVVQRIDPQWNANSQLDLSYPNSRSVVQRIDAHARKEYFSGPLFFRFERQPDGQRPGQDEGWTKVWAQLTGTTLSIWNIKVFQEAGAKLGKGVSPSSSVDVTDVIVQVLDAITVLETSSRPVKRYLNVLTLNTVGSNLLLFLVPSTASLESWVAALRLSAWEKSRLDEIYTAHLISISNVAYDIPTPLIHGQLNGWVWIRIAGQTDRIRVWMVVSKCTDSTTQLEKIGDGLGRAPTRMVTQNTKQFLKLFSQKANSMHLPTKPIIEIYLSNMPEDMKNPLLTMTDVTQAFCVYLGGPHLMSESVPIKLEGTLGNEELAGSMRSREACILVMPEFAGDKGQMQEMLKWVTSFHDAFGLYGRPKSWTWDTLDPMSLMFAYPLDPYTDLLFMDRKLVEVLNPRDNRTGAIRSCLLNILLTRIPGAEVGPSAQTALNYSGALASSQIPDALALQLLRLDFDFGWTTNLPDSTLLMHFTGASRLKLSPLSSHLTDPAAPLTPPVSNTAKADSDTPKEMEERPEYGPLLYLLKIYGEAQAA